MQILKNYHLRMYVIHIFTTPLSNVILTLIKQVSVNQFTHLLYKLETFFVERQIIKWTMISCIRACSGKCYYIGYISYHMFFSIQRHIFHLIEIQAQ